MADSYRLSVLKALTTLIEGTSVTPVAGIELPATLAGVVFRGRTVFGADDPTTMVAILEAPRPGDAFFTENNSARSETWQLLIQGWCPDDKTHPSDPAYSLMDDVERRLDRITRSSRETGYPKFPEHYMLGVNDADEQLIQSFRVLPGVVRPPAESLSSKSFFYLPVQVGLARISD